MSSPTEARGLHWCMSITRLLLLACVFQWTVSDYCLLSVLGYGAASAGVGGDSRRCLRTWSFVLFWLNVSFSWRATSSCCRLLLLVQLNVGGTIKLVASLRQTWRAQSSFCHNFPLTVQLSRALLRLRLPLVLAGAVFFK